MHDLKSCSFSIPKDEAVNKSLFSNFSALRAIKCCGKTHTNKDLLHHVWSMKKKEKKGEITEFILKAEEKGKRETLLLVYK